MRIGLRAKKLGYSLATLGCLAGSALAVFASLEPVDAGVARSAGPVKKGSSAIAAEVAHGPSREELVALSSVRLRRPPSWHGSRRSETRARFAPTGVEGPAR